MVNSRLKYIKLKQYLVNCFLLLVPIFIWNIIFSPYLPEPYTNSDIWNNVPSALLWFEYMAMTVVFVLTFSLPLKIKTSKQRIGLFIYLIGLMIYLLAWREIILYPNGSWSSSLAGFSSLAYTPVIMFFAIGIIGNQLLNRITIRRILYISSAAFLIIIQTWHAILIYQQIH